MTYVKQTWVNGPNGGTPISAARLNHMEDGIENPIDSIPPDTFADADDVAALVPPLPLVDDVLSLSGLTLVAGNPVISSAGFTADDIGKEAILSRAVLRFQTTDGAMTSGSKKVTSLLGSFATLHQGDSILISGAGAAGASLSTTIQYVESATVAYAATAASTTVAGATVNVSRSLATTITAVSPGVSFTVADAPTNNTTTAVLNYGTNWSPTIIAAVVAAGHGGRVRLPAGSFFLDHALSDALPVNVGCIVEGTGANSPTRTGGTRLIYGGAGTGMWMNSNGTNVTNATLRNLTLDGVNCGEIGLAFGSTVGSNKSAVGTVSDVKVERFRTANVRFISAAILDITKLRAQTATGAIGFLFDNVASSGFNTSILMTHCFATQCQKGWVFKDARSIRLVRCESYHNAEEGVVVEQQASGTFSNRRITFDEFRLEGNLVAEGVSGTGRRQMKCSSLGTGTQLNQRITLLRTLFSGTLLGDKDLSLHGGDFLLDHVVWSSTNGGFGADAPAVGGASTLIEEVTNDSLMATANLPNGGGTQHWTFGAGVRYTGTRHTSAPNVEQWVANGGVAGRRNLSVVATSDKTITNSAAPQDDGVLQAWLGANLTYRFRFVVFMQGTTFADAKFAVVTPSGTPRYGIHALALNASAVSGSVNMQSVSGSGTAFPIALGLAGSEVVMFTIEGAVTTTTEGLLKLQFAQFNAEASNIVRKDLSSLEAEIAA